MHRFDEGQDLEALADKLAKEWDNAVEKLNEKESEVYQTILGTFMTNGDTPGVDYPEDFFEQSVDVLNKHFGGHGDRVITENVRKALDAAYKWNMADDDYWEPFEQPDDYRKIEAELDAALAAIKKQEEGELYNKIIDMKKYDNAKEEVFDKPIEEIDKYFGVKGVTEKVRKALKLNWQLMNY